VCSLLPEYHFLVLVPVAVAEVQVPVPVPKLVPAVLDIHEPNARVGHNYDK